MPAPTRFFLLEVVPHAKTVRASRITNPDLSRFRLPQWWSQAIWGRPGGRDPMPLCVSVVELDPSTAQDMLEEETDDDAPGQLMLPLTCDTDTESESESETDDASGPLAQPPTLNIELTEAQAKLLDEMYTHASGILNSGNRFEVLYTDGTSSKVNKGTVRAMAHKGLLGPLPPQGYATDLTDLGYRLARDRAAYSPE